MGVGSGECLLMGVGVLFGVIKCSKIDSGDARTTL